MCILDDDCSSSESDNDFKPASKRTQKPKVVPKTSKPSVAVKVTPPKKEPLKFTFKSRFLFNFKNRNYKLYKFCSETGMEGFKMSDSWAMTDESRAGGSSPSAKTFNGTYSF